jgi:hypothetical protein
MAVPQKLGMIHVNIMEHAFKRDDFNALMVDLRQVLRDKGEDTGIYFVLDNCPV